MSIGIDPSQGLQSQQVSQNNLDIAQEFENVNTSLKEASLDLKEEVSVITKKEAGDKRVDEGGKTYKTHDDAKLVKKPENLSRDAQLDSSTQKAKESPNDLLAAFAAAVMEEEEVKKKKRKKKSKFEEKLEKLAGLEGNIDVEGLDQEEKDVFNQFFDNMATIRRRKSDLNKLEKREQHFLDIIERQKHQSGG